MPQIRQVVSEALQSTVRRLLPSQQGFTEDLMATNVITPIIDLTPSAEGSQLTAQLAAALNFTDGTVFSFNNGSGVIINNTGFWRCVGTSSMVPQSGLRRSQLFVNDGTTDKVLWEHETQNSNSQSVTTVSFDLVFFLPAGHSLNGSNNNNGTLVGSVRQIADVSGNTVNPSDYTAS